jgi:hypothetical protein
MSQHNLPISLYNYCLWPYKPYRPLANDDQPAISLLFESFRLHGVDAYCHELVSQLIHVVGPCQTVFGIKTVDGEPSWEFYFYDYESLNRRLSSFSIIRCFPGCEQVSQSLDDRIPYFMFSLEITLQQIQAQISPSLTFYLGNPGGALFGGKSYCVDSANFQIRFQNIYHFYDYQLNQQEIVHHLSSSLHLRGCFASDGYAPFNAYSFFVCQTLCIAHKPTCDGLYFSGVPLTSLLDFCSTFHVHSMLADFLLNQRSAFDYLLFDVGLDCQLTTAGHAFPKTAIYASF